jgi:hypothetical protein
MTNSEPRRTHSLGVFQALMGRFMTPDADAPVFPAYAPRAKDIIISPYG